MLSEQTESFFGCMSCNRSAAPYISSKPPRIQLRNSEVLTVTRPKKPYMVFSALHSTALSTLLSRAPLGFGSCRVQAGSRHPHSQRRTQNCTAHSQAQAQPITLSPKALVRAPSEQSKVYERLEESVAKKVNLCAAAASLVTGTRRYFALSASLGPRSPRFENAGLRRNGGWKLVQRGGRRRG